MLGNNEFSKERECMFRINAVVVDHFRFLVKMEEKPADMERLYLSSGIVENNNFFRCFTDPASSFFLFPAYPRTVWRSYVFINVHRVTVTR